MTNFENNKHFCILPTVLTKEEVQEEEWWYVKFLVLEHAVNFTLYNQDALAGYQWGIKNIATARGENCGLSETNDQLLKGCWHYSDVNWLVVPAQIIVIDI